MKLYAKKFSYVDFTSANILYKTIGYLPLSEYNKGVLNIDEKMQEKIGKQEFNKENENDSYKKYEKEIIGETFLKVKLFN